MLAGESKSGADGLQRRADELGGVGQRVAGIEVEHDDGALLVREAAEGLAERGPLVGARLAGGRSKVDAPSVAVCSASGWPR